MTVFGKNTAKGREKFIQDLELIHHNFRQYLLANRPDLDIDLVATGEHWLASDAIHLKLVDGLETSDAYIIKKIMTHQVFQIKGQLKHKWLTQMFKPLEQLFQPFA